MARLLQLGGITVKTPHKLKIERYNVTKAGRVASGLMTMDLLAKKVKLVVTYPAISGIELQEILDIIDTDTMFFQVRYKENATIKEITCYTGHIPSEIYRSDNDGYWVWSDVTFGLIQQ